MISYVFAVDNFLYDFTYKNFAGTNDVIALNLFNSMFYSLECNQEDLFTYSNRKFIKEEDVKFALSGAETK